METTPAPATLAASAPPAPPVAPWPGTRSGFGRALLFLLLIAAPLGIIVCLIATNAVDVPFWDQWETARLFTFSFHRHPSLWELARQQNESRLLFPNLIFLALSLPGKWSVVREMYFSVALVAGTSAILFQLLARSGFSLRMQAVLIFTLNWLLFSLTQHENWFFGIQICYYLPPFALCGALLNNVSRRSLASKTLGSLALAFIAVYSFSGGVLICLLAFPGFLPANWSASGGWRPDRRERRWHAVYFLGSAAMLGAYFWDYHDADNAFPPFYFLTHPGESLAYFFAWLGSPLRPRGPLAQSIAAGAVVCALLAGLLLALRRRLADREDQPRLYPWVMLSVYVVGTGVLTVVGRVGYGAPQALSSRYIAFSNYAYVAVIVLGAFLWCLHRPRLAAGPRAVFTVAAGSTLLGVAILFFNAQRLTIPWIEDGSAHRRFAREGLVFLPLMPSSQNLDALCGAPDYVRRYEHDLLHHHVLRIPQVSDTLFTLLQHPDPKGDPAFGILDQPTLDQSGQVSIHGWCVDPYKKVPAGSVLITCTGADGVTHPLVAVDPHLYRPAGAPATGHYQQTPCAFLELVRFDRLPPGHYQVAAWRVVPEFNVLNQIGGVYGVDWAQRGALTHRVDDLAFPPLNAAQGNRNGNLDSVELTPDNHLAAKGWAVDINRGAVAKAVLLTCTDQRGTTRVVAQAGPGGNRTDVASALHNDALTFCGFDLRPDLARLPGGDYEVAAWSIGGSAEETPAQLGRTYPIHLPAR